MNNTNNPNERAQNIMPICPQCLNIPEIQIISSCPGNIRLKCSCQYKDVTTLKDYYTKINGKNNQNILTLFTCSEHNHNKYEYFCEECKLHFCIECNKTIIHQHKLKHISNEVDINSISDNIKKANAFIENEFKPIKEKLIKQLEESIKKIEDSYDKCKINNELVLSFIESLVFIYQSNCSNYILESNLKNNSDFNFSTFNKNISNSNLSIQIEETVNYFNSYSFIKEEVDLSKIKEMRSIDAHKLNIKSLIILSDGRMASCSHDKTIKIYNIHTYKCEVIINKNIDEVEGIAQLDNNILICGTKERKVHFFTIDKREYKPFHTINEVDPENIENIKSLSNNRYATYSRKYIQIWNGKEPYNKLAVLDKHSFGVSALIQLKEKEILVSSGLDKTLRLWNLTNYECITTVSDISYANTLLESGDFIIIGSFNNVTVFNLKSMKIIYSIDEQNGGFFNSLLELRNGNILIGNSYGKVYLYDVYSNKHAVKKQPLASNFSVMIHINKNTFASGCNKKLKFWKY